MEEDIEVLKDFLELREIHSSDNCRTSYLKTYQKAVRNLIARYKELKEDNRILERRLLNSNNRYKRLNDQFQRCQIKTTDIVNSHYIPKLKVKEKIKELEKEYKKISKENFLNKTETQKVLTAQMVAYKKLLEDLCELEELNKDIK